MTLRITATEFDTLVLATEKPEPIALPTGIGAVPINPMVWPHNWSIEVSLETRWQTDVTKSIDNTRPERWAMTSRPTRRLIAKILGGTKEESHALLQSAFDYTTQFGAPVPIYPDATMVTAFASEGLYGRVYGDFRHRRFFVGGRVCFMPARMDPSKAANSVTYATVLELTPDQIRVEFVITAYREPTTLDAVIPCMDVEFVESAGGVQLTDSVYEVDLEWVEIDGASALPGTWPPVHAESAEVLSPLCQIVDNLPIFPFDPNWVDGVSISPARPMDSDRSGRTALQEPLGKPYHEIELSVMGYNREACWNVVRFFDSMQGRAGSFYLIHPQEPWTLFAIPSVTVATFKPAGSIYSIGNYFKKAAFFRANGDIVVRNVSEVSQAGEVFVLTLETALPDTSFVKVQPIMVCSFDQDELVENWATTNVVPAFQLRIVEIPDYGVVSLPAPLGYTEENPGFLGIPDCNLLLRAGAGCLGADQTSPAAVWPIKNAFVKYWRDVSRPVVRTPSKKYLLKQMVAREGSPANNTTADLVLWNAPWQNNGQPSIRDADYLYVPHLDTAVPLDDRHLWSQDNGWTMTMCFTPQKWAVVPVDLTLFQISGNVGINPFDIHFKYDTAGAVSYRNRLLITPPGLPQATINITKDIGLFDSAPIYVTVHFGGGPGGICRVWVNGAQATLSGQGVDLPAATSYSASKWFSFCWSNSPTSSLVINQRFGTHANANLLVSYNRALAIEEVNDLHAQIAEIYRTTQVVSTLY